MSVVSIATWQIIGETETLRHVTYLTVLKCFPGLLALGARHSHRVHEVRRQLDQRTVTATEPSKVRVELIQDSNLYNNVTNYAGHVTILN
jgi:hypothetical protein